MKQLQLLFLLLLSHVVVFAQRIERVEYFYDTDPGLGNASVINFTPADSINITTSLSTSSLSIGFHRLYVRVMDSTRVWSLYDVQQFYVYPEETFAVNLTAGETFSGMDNGQNTGTAFSFTPADSINHTFNISTSSLSTGKHRISIRVKDSLSLWSMYETADVYLYDSLSLNSKITKGEYFYDTDPGLGNASVINFTPADSINITTSLSTSSLSIGFHRLYVRVMDSTRVWSLYDVQQFYVYPEETFAANLTVGETFSGMDNGQNTGTPFSFTPADSINHTFNISTSSLSTGKHRISIRVKDSLNLWSMYETADVYLYDSLSLSSKIIKGEYFYDTDPGSGNAIPITFSATDSINWNNLGLSVNGLSTGRHNVFLRYLNSYNQWSHYEAGSFFLVEEEQPAATLQAVEYFFDHSDPGFGNGTALTISAADSIDISPLISIAALDTGWHSIHVRVKGADGRWSLYETQSFFLCNDFPKAAFTFTQFGLTVNFNNTSTGAASYIWNYGNGQQSTQFSPNYTYATAGSYQVKLYAFNGACPMRDSAVMFVGINPALTFTVQKTKVCTHDSLQLSIATTEAFGIGNQFYVYLSDTAGNFSNATLLGILNSRVGQLFSVYVPTFLLRGTRYRIRLEATAPSIISADNGADITIVPVTFSSFTYTGDTVLCSGNNLLLQGVNGTDINYQWFRNGQSLAGATIKDFPAFLDGSYRLQVTNIYGCSNLSQQYANLTVKPTPVTPGITGATQVSRNMLTTYQVLPGTAGSVYTWIITGGVQIAGGNGNTISVQWGNNPLLGKVEVQETAVNGCAGEVKTIQVSLALSDNSLATLNGVQVYPNPVDGWAMLELSELAGKNVAVHLFDSKGSLVLEQHFTPENNATKQALDLTRLPSGLYHLQVSEGNKLYSNRLIKR
jgi:hypothetical protein